MKLNSDGKVGRRHLSEFSHFRAPIHFVVGTAGAVQEERLLHPQVVTSPIRWISMKLKLFCLYIYSTHSFL